MGRNGGAGRAAGDLGLQRGVRNLFGYVRCVADCADALIGKGEVGFGNDRRERGWQDGSGGKVEELWEHGGVWEGGEFLGGRRGLFMRLEEGGSFLLSSEKKKKTPPPKKEL